MRLSKFGDAADYSVGRRFRFAVVDLDNARGYPLNFVCLLPTKLKADGKLQSVFLQVFGDKSTELARVLLTMALEKEDDFEAKAEIERRLKLFDAKTVSQIKCGACGKLFQTGRVKRVKQNSVKNMRRKSSPVAMRKPIDAPESI